MDTLTADLAAMREALEFYGKEDTYVWQQGYGGQAEYRIIDEDSGKTAQKALSSTSGREMLERMGRMKAALRFYQEGNEWDYGRKASEALGGEVGR